MSFSFFNELVLFFLIGSIVKYKDDKLWTVLIITPVMNRMQQIPQSSEIIFLDSTTGCESTGSTYTVFIVATKACGVRIAVMLHPSQTTESYTNAFSLLKETNPLCFGGKEVSFKVLCLLQILDANTRFICK